MCSLLFLCFDPASPFVHDICCFVFLDCFFFCAPAWIPLWIWTESVAGSTAWIDSSSLFVYWFIWLFSQVLFPGALMFCCLRLIFPSSHHGSLAKPLILKLQMNFPSPVVALRWILISLRAGNLCSHAALLTGVTTESLTKVVLEILQIQWKEVSFVSPLSVPFLCSDMTHA